MRSVKGNFMKKIVVIAGTRPEAIKVVSVIHELKKFPDIFDVKLCSTGQHKEILSQTFANFDIEPDIHLNVMVKNQTLSGLSARLFNKLDKLFVQLKPDIVLVQGDTTSVQVASLVAFYHGISVGHIEAGLRSHNIYLPFPEELNRRVTSLVTKWHFAPTVLSKQNLVSEGIHSQNIIVTGNTVIDALLMMRKKVREQNSLLPYNIEQAIDKKQRIILVTGHRRESFDSGLQKICEILLEISKIYPNVSIVYPVHPNPNVQKIVYNILDKNKNIILCSPLGYKSFIKLMDAAYLIITDSGGIQEEAPSLGKPVLITRDLTERPEGVSAGINILVGSNGRLLMEKTTCLLNDEKTYKSLCNIQNPYGDGTAGKKIVDFLLKITND